MRVGARSTTMTPQKTTHTSAVLQLRDRIKEKQQNSKVVLGHDKEAHRTKTDYRNNFQWTIPKFAM